MEICLLDRSKALDTPDAAYHVRAINIQMERDFAPAYGFEPWPVVQYDRLPSSDAVPLEVLDDIGLPGALGYHDDLAGFIYAKALDFGGPDATTPSHEALEMRADPACDIWRPWPARGGYVAYEACDAVEEVSYGIDVELFGVVRTIQVSNFVLPSWYDAGAPGPYDFLGVLEAPFTMTPGGYLIVMDEGGQISQLFPKTASRRSSLMSKIANSRSRVARRTLKAR